LPPDARVRVDIQGPAGSRDSAVHVVDVDRRWLTLALANLLRNAHRHGQGVIQVTARLGAGSLELVVRDEGPGFPERFRAHAFDRFTRAEESRSTPGSGLGLHLVESVAVAHGGHVEILRGPGAAVRMVLDTHSSESTHARPLHGALSS
jgi:signal transduction histidine kinase